VGNIEETGEEIILEPLDEPSEIPVAPVLVPERQPVPV
jgi:hypothetical protein